MQAADSKASEIWEYPSKEQVLEKSLPFFPCSAHAPIFVFSSERSGSTLLRYILDSHEDICSPGQLYLGTLSETLSTTIHFSVAQLHQFDSEQACEAFVLHETRKIIEGLMQNYASGKKKRVWCDKTTMNLQQRDLLVKVFPDARYLCLYRQCLDVVHSCIKFSPMGFMSELAPYVAREPSNFVAAMVESWVEKTEQLLAFERNHPDQVFRLTYEDLVQIPEETLSAAFDFLQLPWDKRLLQNVFSQPHDQGSGDLKVQFSSTIHTDSIGTGIKIPVSSIPNHLIERINYLHQILGFPGIDSVGDQSMQIDRKVESRLTKEAPQADFSFYDYLSNKLEGRNEFHKKPLGRCQFIVQGNPNQSCFTEFLQQEIRLKPGMEELSDCTISLTLRALLGLCAGRLSLMEAYEGGEISAQGDLTMAISMAKHIFADT